MATTNGGKPKQSSLGGQLVIDTANNRIYFKINEVYQILFGVFPGNYGWGFIITKDGEDVLNVFD